LVNDFDYVDFLLGFALVIIIITHTHMDFVWDYPVSQHQKGATHNQEGKTNLDLLEQKIVSGIGISWVIC